MKYIRYRSGDLELFKIFSADVMHSDEAKGIERVDIISAGFIYFDFMGDNPEWYISPFGSTSLDINPRADDTEFFRQQFKL